METKQVILVRNDLKMRKGKIAAQVAHASMKVFFDRMRWNSLNSNPNQFLIDMTPEMTDWFEGIFAKICLKVDSEEQLDDFHQKAQDAGLPCALIVDSGRTVFKRPTKTCLAIGPASVDEIDKITKDLKLL